MISEDHIAAGNVTGPWPRKLETDVCFNQDPVSSKMRLVLFLTMKISTYFDIMA